MVAGHKNHLNSYQIFVSGSATNSVNLYSNTFTKGAGTNCGVTIYGGNSDIIGNTSKSWPWATTMADAFARLRLIPVAG